MASRAKKRVRDPMPTFIPPMMAEPVDHLPPIDEDDDTEWGHEPKLDGHRLQIRKDGEDVRILSRKGLNPQVDVTRIVAQAREIKAERAIIDGEGAAIDSTGRTNWAALERRDIPLTYFGFDFVYSDKGSLLIVPLRERQDQLAEAIEGTGLQLCRALPGELDEIIQTVHAMGFEGIVSKDQQSPYRPGRRSFEWQKKPFEVQQEFVLGGFKPDGNDRVATLLVGVYDGSKLMFASQLHGGLNPTNRAQIRKALEGLRVARCPFANLPTSSRRGKTSWDSGGVSAEEMAEIFWVRPKLLAEIKFRHWTEGGLLRHPKFIRLRTDKAAKEVVRET